VVCYHPSDLTVGGTVIGTDRTVVAGPAPAPSLLPALVAASATCCAVKAGATDPVRIVTLTL
jgi:hypothetical protein